MAIFTLLIVITFAGIAYSETDTLMHLSYVLRGKFMQFSIIQLKPNLRRSLLHWSGMMRTSLIQSYPFASIKPIETQFTMNNVKTNKTKCLLYLKTYDAIHAKSLASRQHFLQRCPTRFIIFANLMIPKNKSLQIFIRLKEYSFNWTLQHLLSPAIYIGLIMLDGDFGNKPKHMICLRSLEKI